LNSYALATILCVGTNSFALTGAGITWCQFKGCFYLRIILQIGMQ
jgi:hypothetical protein